MPRSSSSFSNRADVQLSVDFLHHPLPTKHVPLSDSMVAAHQTCRLSAETRPQRCRCSISGFTYSAHILWTCRRVACISFATVPVSLPFVISRIMYRIDLSVSFGNNTSLDPYIATRQSSCAGNRKVCRSDLISGMHGRHKTGGTRKGVQKGKGSQGSDQNDRGAHGSRAKHLSG